MRTIQLRDKFERVLELTGQNRTAYARKAGITLSMLSRLIPKDGSKPQRRASTGTILGMIHASEGRLSIEDFAHLCAADETPIRQSGICLFCGRPTSQKHETGPEGSAA
ncbi:MAG: 3,4-dihydroxy-2-butanone 4-phosphate synthase [Rhodomicrobium sp.]